MERQEHATTTVVHRFAEAWNAHDAAVIAAFFTDDAEFINAYGAWWRGRAEIERRYATLHAGAMHATRLDMVVRVVRHLAPHIVLTYSTWELFDTTAAAGPPPMMGRGVLSAVLTEQDEVWRIASGQNTEVAPHLPWPPVSS